MKKLLELYIELELDKLRDEEEDEDIDKDMYPVTKQPRTVGMPNYPSTTRNGYAFKG